MDVRPFTIAIENSVLEDLQKRLADTRWPDEIPNTGWDYGSNLGYLKELVEYWRTKFDWRAQEAKLNAFNHFKSKVDGLDIHFIHEKGKGPNPIPLIITHGWPSCFFEMTKIIPLLADPASHGGDAADSFDVVAPSLPGFGFSDHAQERGMEVQRVAGMWNKLMTQNLGYPKFAAQGGDIGSGVTARLGFAHSDTLFGIHLTSITRPTPYMGPGSKPVTDAEQALITQRDKWFADEGGYNHIQGTKPQTLAYGLNDSPVGLAAWIVEKYRTWSDCGGDVEKSYTKDELLTIVTIYWVTQTISSSTR
ncbi:MAG: epoxide hydrolase, partial [SAR202 cluster bacterium]|nr:epoxide hydrolase [SAR202 cluster bacterium]